METMVIQKNADKLPAKLWKLLLNGKNITLRDHSLISCRVNDLIFNLVNEPDMFSPHLYLSRSAYEAFKSKRYGKTIDVTTSHDMEFLYNKYASSDFEDNYIIRQELFVIRRDGNNLFSIVGYTRLGECLACLNQDVLNAMKSFLTKHCEQKNTKIECSSIPKVFGHGITFIK